MAASGVYWFNGPDKFEQRLSIMADQIPGKAEHVVDEVQKKAVKKMQEIVNAGGMNPTKKGGARRLNDDMYDSIKGRVFTNSRARVQGEFGFIDAPAWTLFQERGTLEGGGTGTGIAPMWAYAEAQILAADEFSDQIDNTKWFQTSKI